MYILGDDARQVLFVDGNHNLKDSIRLFDGQGRFDKDEKPDFESAFLFDTDGNHYIVALGSFATANRCRVGWINLDTRKLEKLDTVSLPQTGIAAVNIEGSTIIGKTLVLGNRANHSYPTNHLLLIDWGGKTNLQYSVIKTIKLTFPKSVPVIGLSDIYYDAQRDWLLFTASTENTMNAYSDGAIGDSYVGYIKTISSKLGQQAITPDRFLNLKTYLSPDQAYKIEGITMEGKEAGELLLHLSADNDNGQSTLFKLRWKL
jgi:hypothetical protein